MLAEERPVSVATSIAVTGPEHLTDLDVHVLGVNDVVADDALLSARHLDSSVTWAFYRPLDSAPEEPPRRRIAWVNPRKLPTPGNDSTTVGTIATQALAPWVRNTVPRLLRLCQLGENWDSYGSPAPSAQLVQRIVDILRLAETDEFPEPEVVPASGGGIQLEWYMGDRELEIEFTPDRRIEFLATDNRTGGEVEEELRDLDDIRFRLLWVVQEA